MGKIMSFSEMELFINGVRRNEWHECPRSYNKALRVALINLGYDFEWVEGEFRDYLDSYQKEYIC